MIIKNGKVLAINSVKHDDTLQGNGLSGDKLGLSQKVRDVIDNKQNKLTPADNTIAISDDKIKVNTSGISAQQIHPSVFDPYASKNWVNEQGFLKQVNLEPYALSADVRREFDASAAWVNDRFEHIPGAEAYYGGNGIKVIGHQINLTADVVSHNELSDALNPYATKEWVEEQDYLTNADLSNFATKEYARQASAAAVTSAKNWVESQNYLKADALDPYAKTSDVNAQFTSTSAWANDKFQVKGDYLTSASLNNYYKKDETYSQAEIDELLANFGGFRIVNGDEQNLGKPVLIDGKLSDGSIPNEKTIYLTKVSDLQQKDNYREWIWKKDQYNVYDFVCVGMASIDLQGYVTDEELEAELLKYYTKTEVSAMFDLTSAWAIETFQPIGNYASATDLDNYYTKSEVNTKFTETSSWATDTFQVKGDYLTSADLNNYYTKTEVNDQFDDLSATVSNEYAKKTDIPEVPVYTAANEYIKITDDYGISGYDWTNELSAKQDKLTIEQFSAISSVSSIQIASGDWVTSASDIISAAGLAYFLVKDGDSSKWQGVNLATLGGSYNVVSEDEALLHVATARDEDKTTFTLSAKDWSTELSEKVDQDEFDNTVDQIADVCATLSGDIDEVSATIDDLSATVERDYVKKGEIPEPVFYDISAKYAMAQSGTYNDKDYYFISGAEIVGSNGVSAEYNAETNTWDVGLSANDLEYMYDTYRSTGVVSAGTIIPFNGTNYHNIVVDENGLITLPETTNKFTFCINETIDNNNPGTHAYLLNKLILSATDNTELVSTQNYYPTEVGTSNATIAITVDHTVAPTRKYCVVYDGSEIPATAHLNVTASIVEEVISTNDNSVLMNDYIGDSPISVNNDSRKIGLKYDNQIFTLNSDNQLTLTNGSTDTPIDPEVFDKLVNSINGRMTETIPFGALNTVADLVGSMQYSYLFRPSIEYEFSPLTQAYMNGGNADDNEYISVAIYEGVTGQSNMLWESQYALIPRNGGQVVMNTREYSPLGTIHPEQLYYVCIRIDKLNEHGGTWHNVLGLDMGSNTTVDMGNNPKPWLGLLNVYTLDFVTPYDFATAGSMDKFGGIKPYVGFRTRTI